jgi:hypothetical protein
LQGGPDLEPHIVGWIIETAAIVRACSRKPAFADDRDERVAPAEAIRKGVDEINAGRDAVDVEEDVLVPEVSGQSIVYPPSKAAGILSTIGN